MVDDRTGFILRERESAQCIMSFSEDGEVLHRAPRRTPQVKHDNCQTGCGAGAGEDVAIDYCYSLADLWTYPATEVRFGLALDT